MRPQPTTDYFKLSPAAASHVAWKLSKFYGMELFREWTAAYAVEYNKREAAKRERQLVLL